MRYKVNCRINWCCEDWALSLARNFIQDTKTRIGDFVDEEGFIKSLFAGNAICREPGVYEGCFEAPAGWENIIADCFRAACPGLHQGSSLEIHTEAGYRIIRPCEDGEIQELAGTDERAGSPCDIALMYSPCDVEKGDIIGLACNFEGKKCHDLMLDNGVFCIRGYATEDAIRMLEGDDPCETGLGRAILAAIEDFEKDRCPERDIEGLHVLITKKEPVYRAFKEMLRKRKGQRADVSKTPEEILMNADRFLSRISLGRYMGELTADALIEDTFPDENPLCFMPTEVWEREFSCIDANRKMQEKYGPLHAAFNSPIGEFISWCALFPEHIEELYKEAFRASEDYDPRFEVIFRYIYGCDFADALPLPAMVTALNACLFRQLMREGEEGLAMSIIRKDV